MAKARRRRGKGLYLKRDPHTGIYQIRGTFLGSPVRKSTGTSDLAVAEALIMKIQGDMQKRHVEGDEAVLTFDEAATEYIESGGSNRFMKPLTDHFGKMRVKDIKQKHVAEFIRIRYSHLGPAAKNRQVFTPLISVLNHASDVHEMNVAKFKRPEIKKVPVEPAPDEWTREFLAKCTLKNLKAVVWLLTTTGARVSEVTRIKPGDVNLKRKSIVVQVTKTDEARMLPLDPDLAVLVAELIEDRKADPHCYGRLFGYSGRYSVKMALVRECRKLGMRYYSTHKIGRHAIATRMLDAGHTLAEVQKAVGWASYRMVAETYGHLEQSKAHGVMLGVSRGLAPDNDTVPLSEAAE